MKTSAIRNRKSSQKTADEEQENRQKVIEETLRVYRNLLPILLTKLSKIQDPRQPGKVKHMLTTLMVYGILIFVIRISSRREANREMTQPLLFENLKELFPELESMPHADTLARLLETIEVEEIQDSAIELVKTLIRKKKFRRLLIQGKYLIAIDGTQKFMRDEKWDKECLERHVGKEKQAQYYVYVLEAVLIFDNGIAIPLRSEFLKSTEYKSEAGKQDCERKAFVRMAHKLKQQFPKLKIAVTLDGLYACGPIFEICCKYKWDYMIVLKDNSLKEVWREFKGLSKVERKNRYESKRNGRQQKFHWVNNIDYWYGDDVKKTKILHVVVCEETWQETKKDGTVEQNSTKYAWVSAKPLTNGNVSGRCNLIGRYRWKIENNILAQKHQGYEYEHCFSYKWEAMEGYHYLMNISRIMNVFAVCSEYLFEQVILLGIDGYLKLVLRACAGSLLDHGRIREIVRNKYQLRLVS